MSNNFKHLTKKDLPFNVRTNLGREQDIRRELAETNRNLPRLKAICAKHSITLTMEVINSVNFGRYNFIESAYLAQLEGYAKTLPPMMQTTIKEEAYTKINAIKREFIEDEDLIRVSTEYIEPDTLEVYPLDHFIDQYSTRVKTEAGMALYNEQMDLLAKLKDFTMRLPDEHRSHVMGNLQHRGDGDFEFLFSPNYNI
ncbi:MAG: hypothetical protein SNJ29_10755 [Rikenellaceae bacterium]